MSLRQKGQAPEFVVFDAFLDLPCMIQKPIALIGAETLSPQFLSQVGADLLNEFAGLDMPLGLF